MELERLRERVGGRHGGNSTAGPTRHTFRVHPAVAPTVLGYALLTWLGDLRALSPVHLRQPRDRPRSDNPGAGRRPRRGPVPPSGPPSGGGRSRGGPGPALPAGLGGPGRAVRAPD